MSKDFRRLPSANGVVEGQTATINLPVGGTYHGVMLDTSGSTTLDEGDISEIRVNANGKTIMRASGDDLDLQNAFEGKQIMTSADLLYVDFERHGLKTRGGVELTAIGTGFPQDKRQFINRGGKKRLNPLFNPTPIRTLQMEVDLSGTTAPSIVPYAYRSPASPLGTIKKRRKFILSPSAAGVFEWADMPREDGDPIDKIWLHTTLTINSVVLETDAVTVFDRTPAINNWMQNDGIRTSQSNLFVLDPSERGNGAEPYVTRDVDDFRLKIDVAAGGTITAYVDYLGGLAKED